MPKIYKSNRGLTLLETMIGVVLIILPLWGAAVVLIRIIKLNDAVIHAVEVQRGITFIQKSTMRDDTRAMWEEDEAVRDLIHPCNQFNELFNVPEAPVGQVLPYTLMALNTEGQSLKYKGSDMIRIGKGRGDAKSIELIQIGPRLSTHPPFIPTVLKIRSASINSMSPERDYEIPIILKLNPGPQPATTFQCESQRYGIDRETSGCASLNLVWDDTQPWGQECQ